ncbi:MAG: hypothetical protein HPY57_15230 [Ignavibacteria bacterium]|nr:hypothetical protein [Ignavibacteria bacterium]
MKTLKNYNTFIFENAIEMQEIFNDADILESIVTDSDELLNTIKAKEVDLFQVFELNPDKLKSNFTIQELYDNKYFNKALVKKGFKKNELESTEETETFLDDSIVIKFFSIFKNNASELEQPEYIIYQSKKRNQKDWGQVKCYKVNDNMKNFYDKLTNKSIEIKKGDKTYIYVTSNSGNDWQLQKSMKNQQTDRFKEYMTNDDIKAILLDDDVSITILA